MVDADINLQNARKMIEKLRLKQNEELEVSSTLFSSFQKIFLMFIKHYVVILGHGKLHGSRKSTC